MHRREVHGSGLAPDMWGWMGNYSVVPTIVVDSIDLTVLVVNKSARTLLNFSDPNVRSLDVIGVSHPDDAEGLSGAIETCRFDDGSVRYRRHRFIRPNDTDAVVELAVVGCGSDGLGRRPVMLQMRDVSAESSMSVFARLVADDPDGDALANAIARGPLSRSDVRAVSIHAADHERRQMVHLGSHGVEPRQVNTLRVIPLDHSHPGGAAVLNTETVRLSLPALVERFPLVATEAYRQPFFSTSEVLTLPILSRGVAVGSLFLLAGQPFPQTWDFHELVVTIAQLLSPWVMLRYGAVVSAAASMSRRSAFFVSDRERTIARLVGEGRTNGQIAAALGFSDATVRADLSRLAKMLGVSGRHEIAHRVAELDL